MQLVRSLSDDELLAALKSGRNPDGPIKLLYRNYFDSLSWYVINNSGTRQDAEDVFQEVVVSFINLVQKDKFRGESSIKTFLFSLNRHIWLNELKRRGRELAREEKFEKNLDREGGDVSVTIIEREARTAIAELLTRLGETCKKILVLFYYDNASMRDILETLHYENEQVDRNKKYKCLKQLETMIAENPNLKEKLKSLLHE
jgi:RNA polymerase sigma factor (sigma-70 family)